MSKNPVRQGFDSPVSAREEDHLGRWPVAKEIFRVATESPPDWSVRIGVYGEWGCGKTSVLSFVRQMAENKGHLLVWFNPWECTSADALWKAFVGAVHSELEKVRGQTLQIIKAKAKGTTKGLLEKTGKPIAQAASILRPGTEGVAEAGLDFLKSFLKINKEDLGDIPGQLDGKRLLVVIDDLDRTNPDLVPEVLFALKEVLDVPGIAFICAFDPKVVGQVLREYHPGFGNGLKFLEKIIDYPRWLPTPSIAGMAALAHAEMLQHCQFVPLPELLDAVAALPKNPRVLRQYIRLLALLRQQVERHHDFELVWPVILAANDLKIHHPQLAQEILGDEALLEEIVRTWVQLQGGEEKEGTLAKLMQERLAQAEKRLQLELPETDRGVITGLLVSLFEKAIFWAVNSEAIKYQLHIAEAPHAVTWKEFDALLAKYRREPSAETVTAWIAEHARTVDRTVDEIYRELVQASVQRRTGALEKVADTKVDSDMQSALDDASAAMSLLEHLVLSLGGLDRAEKCLSEREVRAVLGGMLAFIEWETFKHFREQRARARELLVSLFRSWSGNVDTLVNVLHDDGSRPDALTGRIERALRKELHEIVMPRFAEQTLARFNEEGFVGRIMRDDAAERFARALLLTEGGELWKGLRREASVMMACAAGEPVVHRNIVELLYRFDHMLRNQQGHPETKAVEVLLRNKRIAKALWTAVVARRLNPRMIGQLRELPVKLEEFGVKVKRPRWWTEVRPKTSQE